MAKVLGLLQSAVFLASSFKRAAMLIRGVEQQKEDRSLFHALSSK